jgi:hypothetical protein
LIGRGELTVSPPPPTLACTDWTPARRLDIGRRGVVAVKGEVTLREAEPCRTVFELVTGSITVHAEELGGGELAVVSGEERVVVRGTLFSVERADGATVISTQEGVVEVLGRARVPAGWRARITRHTVKQTALDRVDADRMRRAVGVLAEKPETPEQAQAPEKAQPPDEAEAAAKPVNSDERPKRRRARIRRRRRRRPSVRPRAVELVEVPPTATDLIRRAHEARDSGDLETARSHFREAGRLSGTNAEAAWLGLARMELAAKRPRAALEALHERTRRFVGGALALEAAWLEVQALKSDGDEKRAREAARSFLKRWPDSPQAELARRFLKEQ